MILDTVAAMTEACIKPIIVDDSKVPPPENNNTDNNNNNNNNKINDSHCDNHNSNDVVVSNNNNGSEDSNSNSTTNDKNKASTDDPNTPTGQIITQQLVLTSPRSTDTDEQIEKLEFFSGNPNVEVLNGVIHLYRYKQFSTPDHFTLPVTSPLSTSLPYLHEQCRTNEAIWCAYWQCHQICQSPILFILRAQVKSLYVMYHLLLALFHLFSLTIDIYA
jgi:hypothetical protein